MSFHQNAQVQKYLHDRKDWMAEHRHAEAAKTHAGDSFTDVIGRAFRHGADEIRQAFTWSSATPATPVNPPGRTSWHIGRVALPEVQLSSPYVIGSLITAGAVTGYGGYRYFYPSQPVAPQPATPPGGVQPSAQDMRLNLNQPFLRRNSV
jgi:hypothetical protein